MARSWGAVPSPSKSSYAAMLLVLPLLPFQPLCAGKNLFGAVVCTCAGAPAGAGEQCEPQSAAASACLCL